MSKLVFRFVTSTAKEKTFQEKMEEVVEQCRDFYNVTVKEIGLAALPEDGASLRDESELKVIVNGSEVGFDNDLKHGQYETVSSVLSCAIENGYDLVFCELT